MAFLTWHWNKRKTAMLMAVAISIAGSLPLQAIAAELLMLEQEGCVYCAKFNREIAPAYAKTDEGKMAPLRRIDIHQQWPEDLVDIRPTALTPTFILVENNTELGRLHGYNGDEYFWFLLGELLDQANIELPETSQ